MAALVITTFPSAIDTDGRRRAVPWPLFVDDLRKMGAKAFAGEKAHPGWSAATFAGEQRDGENVRHVNALVLDADDAGLDQVAELLAGTRAVLHTTRRATPDAPRCRAIAPYTRSVTPDEHARIWRVVADAALARGFEVDPQTKDPGRFWYAPGSMHNYLSCASGRRVADPDLLFQASAPAPGTSSPAIAGCGGRPSCSCARPATSTDCRRRSRARVVTRQRGA